jgi:phosphate transport system substrate-binding protein
MKKSVRLRYLVALLVLVIGVSTIFAACGQKTEENTSPQPANEESDGLSGTISVVGSTSVAPLAQELADEFNKTETGLKIDIQAVGSSAGIKAAIDGSGDIGMSSRDLKEEEKGERLTEHVIAMDGIAIAVHPNNKVTDLTAEQITKIFKGEIKNWKEVGGDDKEILVVSREAGSGTRGAFEELTSLEGKKNGKTFSLLAVEALIAEGNGAVKANIASKENAIGYLSLGYLDDTVKTVIVDGVEPTVENIKAKKYVVSRPFLMLTKDDMKPEVKAFIDYIMSDEGQKIVAENYISVN